MVVGTFCIFNNYTMLLLNDICFQFQHYATTFPIVSVDDMVHAFFLALDSLGIQKVTQHYDVKSNEHCICFFCSNSFLPLTHLTSNF